MWWVDRKYRERQAPFIVVCTGFNHIWSFIWIRNFHCQGQQCNTTRFYIWVYERALHTKNYKVTYMLFATITEDHIGASICKNIAFVNNPRWITEEIIHTILRGLHGPGSASMRISLWVSRSGCAQALPLGFVTWNNFIFLSLYFFK